MMFNPLGALSNGFNIVWTHIAGPSSGKHLRPPKIEIKNQAHSTNRDKRPIPSVLDPCDAPASPEVIKSNASDTSPADASREEPSLPVSSLIDQLNDERKLRAEAETQLLQLKPKLRAFQLKWKRTARELDELQSQALEFNQLTDEELKDMTTQLRYNIRNFALQYFSDPPSPDRFTPKGSKYDRYVPSNYKSYLEQPYHCPQLVEKFLWRVLVYDVFDRFLWAGDSALALDHLWCLLDSSK